MRDRGTAATARSVDGDDLHRRLGGGQRDVELEPAPVAAAGRPASCEPTRTITRRVPGAARPATSAVRELVGRRLLDRGRRWRSGDHGGTVAFGRVPILAHLDLDAFFAAVEELEDPSLRTRPLVVGGDPQGRGVVATANYVARRFGIRSAMSSAEALRRCPEVVFVRPRHALYRQYSQAVWGAIREVVPRVEQVGIDEGYLDLGTVVPHVHGRARRRRGGADLGARRDVALVLARRLDVEGRLQGRLGPAQAGRDHGRAAGQGGAVPRAVPGARAARGRAEGGAAARGGRREDGRRASPRLSDAELRASCPGSIGPLLRDRALGIDPRDLELETERVSISVEETFERDISDRALLHAEIERLADELSAADAAIAA